MLFNLLQLPCSLCVCLNRKFILGKKNLKFAKIYTSLEVLQRYAEILKIRMPIKKFSAEMLHSESAEGEDMLEFKLTQIDGSRESNLDSVRNIYIQENFDM